MPEQEHAAYCVLAKEVALLFYQVCKQYNSTMQTAKYTLCK